MDSSLIPSASQMTAKRRNSLIVIPSSSAACSAWFFSDLGRLNRVVVFLPSCPLTVLPDFAFS